MLRDLQNLISGISGKFILIGGVLNTSDLQWREKTCSCRTGSRLNKVLKDLVERFGLCQYAASSTLNDAVLDFLFL